MLPKPSTSEPDLRKPAPGPPVVKNLGRSQSLKQLNNKNLKARPTKFKDVTRDLAQEEGLLELHPTKSAPSAAEIAEEVARKREEERLRYFGVPTKIYESEESTVDLSRAEYTEDDAAELRLYGSRVVLDNRGRVQGIEVRDDLIHDPKKKVGHTCQVKN